MLAPLAAPYADTRADALRFALGLGPLDALAVLPVALPGGHAVELRLLGASHQVIADGLSETVACLPGAGAPLPARHDATAGPLAYAFAARTERHADDAAFARAVAAVRTAHDGRPDALTGAFPGSPHAVTVLALDPPDTAGIGWRTWHAYPQTREIVMTASRLAVAP